MRIALAAQHLRASHTMARVVIGPNGAGLDRAVEAWPSRTRVVLGVRIEQRVAACGTPLCAGGFGVDIGSGKGRLGKREGDEVTAELPWGTSKFRVIALNQ